MIPRFVFQAVLVLLFLSVAAAPGAAPAVTCVEGSTAAYFNLEVSAYTWCQLPFNTGIVTVVVRVAAVPFQRIRFTLPDPPMGIVVGESWGVAHTGDRLTGLEVDMGGCAPSGWVAVGSLTVLVVPGTTAPCTFWQVADGCEIQDCEGNWRAAIAVQYQVGSGYCGDCCFQCCYFALPPYNLYPPDGAVDVPLDVVLSWDGTPDIGPPPPFQGCRVRISTSPDCGTGQWFTVPCDVDAFAPDFLQPGTTYYWQPAWAGDTGGCSSGATGGLAPLRSFTTGVPLATTPATWGHVKSLYRQ